MALIELPCDFKFKHVMAHTLPGFFSAITLYMLIDIWSPLNLTPMITKDLGEFATFLGFIFLIGTIIGVILDGIHHSIIEDNFFDFFPEFQKIKKQRNIWISRCNGFAKGKKLKQIDKLKISRHYSFKTIESKLTEINNFVIEDYYSYSEFYSNTFLSLMFFSFIIPYYLLENFQLPWLSSVSIGYISALLAVICLFSSYSSYKNYALVINSIMFGYVKGEGNSPVTSEIKGDIPVKGDIKIDLKGV